MSGMRSSPFRYIHFRLCYFYRELITKIHVFHKQLMGFAYQVQVKGGNYANDPLGWRLGL